MNNVPDIQSIQDRVASMVEALTGERHPVVPEKRRGYWYAKCGPYSTRKGISGVNGEYTAVKSLDLLVSEQAKFETQSLSFRCNNARRCESDAVDAEASLKRAEESMARAKETAESARAKASQSRQDFDAAVSQATARMRAVWAVQQARLGAQSTKGDAA